MPAATGFKVRHAGERLLECLHKPAQLAQPLPVRGHGRGVFEQLVDPRLPDPRSTLLYRTVSRTQIKLHPQAGQAGQGMFLRFRLDRTSGQGSTVKS